MQSEYSVDIVIVSVFCLYQLGRKEKSCFYIVSLLCLCQPLVNVKRNISKKIVNLNVVFFKGN